MKKPRTPSPTEIKALRKARSWSVKDLAEACGVSPRTVENWEQGRTGISGPARKLLARIEEESNYEIIMHPKNLSGVVQY